MSLRQAWAGLGPDIHPLLLIDGDDHEVVADKVEKHWVTYVVPVLTIVGGLLVWLVVVPFTSQQAGWFPMLFGLLLVGYGAVRALQRKFDVFVITDQKVFRVHGVLHRNVASMPLGRILDTTVDKPLLGRLVNYGHFTFESAAQDQGLREIRHVADIDQRNLTIQRVTRDAGLRGKRRVP